MREKEIIKSLKLILLKTDSMFRGFTYKYDFQIYTYERFKLSHAYDAVIESMHRMDASIFSNGVAESFINAMAVHSIAHGFVGIVAANRSAAYLPEKREAEKLMLMLVAASYLDRKIFASKFDAVVGSFFERLFSLLAEMPVAWRERWRRDLIAPLAAAAVAGLGEEGGKVRKIFRLFSLPDVSAPHAPSEGFIHLAVELAREHGISASESPVKLLRGALESAFGVDEVARAEREIDDLAQEVLALPDDPCALIREVYGPYLENGPLVAAGVMSVARWNRLVRLSRGEGLPADIGLALRTVFAERA